MEYSIGDFSRICRLGVKTLRYYHEIGLLNPTRIDRHTGYRYYNEPLLERVRIITRLKSMDFTLDEIRDILENNPSGADLVEVVAEKITGLEQKMNDLRMIHERLKGFLQSEQFQQSMAVLGSVSEVLVPDVFIISTRFQGRYDEIGDFLERLYIVCGSRVAGRPFSLYYDNQSNEEDADIEICLPVAPSSSFPGYPSRLLAGEKALSILHTGSYENLSLSYQVIVNFINRNIINYQLPLREIYLKGPGLLTPGDPDLYLTEIQFMLAPPV